MRYLEEVHRIPIHSRDEEVEQFVGFYQRVATALGASRDPAHHRAAAITRTDGERLVPYEDVPGGLRRLSSRDLRLAILSESWPSLRRTFKRLSLDALFEAIIISAEEGKLKDDPLLFEGPG